MSNRNTSVRIECPQCFKELDRWVYDSTMGGPRGSGRGKSHDAVDPGDGTAEWVRYHCRVCKAVSIWPTKMIASAHFRAMDRGDRVIRWNDLGLKFEDDGSPLPWDHYVRATTLTDA